MKVRAHFATVAALATVLHGASAEALTMGKPVHAIALYGEPKYGANFDHFDYVNTNAPKGGTFIKTNESFLTFDTLNPYTLKGAAVHGLELLLFDTLMAPGQDEPATAYVLIAQTAEIAPDNSWVQFVIRPEARFTDGSAITADDVVFSYETMIAKAFPRYRIMYADVDKAEAVKPDTVRFTFKVKSNRKLSLQIAAYLPILSKAYWKDRDSTATTLDVPVTTGPYLIESFEPGKFIVYHRWDNYWGKDLPVNRGLWNFERVRFEYFRDDDVEFEAFKTGVYDFKREVSSRRWATAYTFPAVTDGRVKLLPLQDIQPVSTQPISFNLRRPLFQDRRVRQALNYAFDFESLNNNIFYKQYERSRSYWQGSPLEAKGLPSAAELKLLEPFRDKVPAEVFTAEFMEPTTPGVGDARDNLTKAQGLLKEAGWEVRDGKLTNVKTGAIFAFEILNNQQTMERVYLPYTQNLKRLGIDATVRLVDTAQFINRVNDFDFDATLVVMPHNDLTPGAEQAEIWGSDTADAKASNNLSGVKDPVVDALLKAMIGAETYDDLAAATHALDRVLTWNFYQLLTYTSPIERYAYWSKLKMPEVTPALGIGGMGEVSGGMGESAIALWWMDPTAGQSASAATPQSAPGSGHRDLIIALCVAGGLAVVLYLVRRRRPPELN